METLEPKISKDLEITLERRHCYGTCPVYKLAVFGDGRVIYQGERFVKEVGERTKTLSPDEVKMLVNEFDRAGYFSFKDEYADYSMTDMPTTVTSIRIEGRSKRVEHYHGDFSTPKKLIRLENLIDEIVRTIEWIT